ncbi:hypothetical protein [Methylobacterium nonmethylotrophicum]|uniref:Uncharacterized protein n=1 Tax=Methylobacterium nonmethylotrophicum TaxID=1141884 RepID=A0A4Z0NTT0_9HYPH|nr:hypothetical protein [Methylobacterium nonmethylotrophicum]TGE00304.1 hypothetical protein EU555_10495 [Methylobacterium nonmethylotrophicum]
MNADPVLHKDIPTHYANLMIQYMVARRIKLIIPNLRLSNFIMPYWNICHEPILENDASKICAISDENHFNFQRISYLAESKIYDYFKWRGYGQRLDNFPSKDECRMMFSRSDIQVVKYGPECLVCPVRGAEILDAIHPGYTVIPIDFYSDIVEQTGLYPIFMGQIADNPYVRALRARFPRAEFIPHMGAIEDFQTIRSAANIVVPVSTFGWLAAWLSYAQRIILPVFGMFNPKLFSLHDLLPLGDPAYVFYEFPPQPAVAMDKLLDAHAAIRGLWRRVDREELARP